MHNIIIADNSKMYYLVIQYLNEVDFCIYNTYVCINLTF